MNNVEIINETGKKIEYIDTMKKLIDFAIKHENLENVIFNIIIVDNEYIHALNREYRKIDRPTDVISFALEDSEEEVKSDFRVLGDIYISIDKDILDKHYIETNWSQGHMSLSMLEHLLKFF